MKRNIFNKKIFMSIVCLLFVAIIPLCSINLYNYSQALLSTSQEDTLDEENGSERDEDLTNTGEIVNQNPNNETEDGDVTTTASGYWTDYDTTPSQIGGAYVIDSAGDLAWMANQSSLTGTYNLAANINLSAHYWIPIMNFAGTFNGNGFTISGLTINESHVFEVSFILEENGRVVTYPNCIKVYSNDYHFFYGLIGYVSGSAEINNVIVSGNITLNFEVSTDMFANSYVFEVFTGGVLGGVLFNNVHQTLSITNCVNKVAINATITNSGGGVFSSLSDTLIVGGVAGMIGNFEQNGGDGPAYRVLVQNCINFANVFTNTIGGGDGTMTAGIVGQLNFGDIKHCVNYGNVSGAGKWTAGIVAMTPGGSGTKEDPDYSASIKYCLNFGNIKGRNGYGGEPCTGGIAGQVSYDSWFSSEFSYVASCANFGNVDGESNKNGGLGEIVGWIGGDGAQINNCYARQVSRDKAVNYWIGRYGGSVAGGEKDDNFEDNSGTARNNETFTGNFNSYGALFSGGYDAESINETWTGINFYSTDVTDDVCQNSSKAVTLSSFVRDMEIKVKIWEDGELVNFRGSDFWLDSATDGGLVKDSSNLYNFYSTITTSIYTAFNMVNYGGYSVTVYETDTTKENDLGDVIKDTSTATRIEYALTGTGLNQGTYSDAFDDITIVLELEEMVEISDDFFRVWTSRSLYDGSTYFPSDLELSKEGLYTISISINNQPYVEGSGYKVDSTVSITITPNAKFEILGVYTHEDFDDKRGRVDRRLTHFNDMTYEGVEGEEETRQRVTSQWYTQYSGLTLSFKISDLILDYEITGEGEDQKVEFTYPSGFDIVFTAYRQDYNFSVNYQDSGFDDYYLEKGYNQRARWAERTSYATNFYYSDSPTSTRLANTISLSSGGNYFTSSAFVEYVADVSGEVNGYWSSSYGSSVSGMSFRGSYVQLSPSSFFAYADPWTITTITFKYCESPRYDYTYTIYITDAYEEYDTGQYLPGQLVGETDYYASSMISKQDISVRLPSGELMSVPSTRIPTAATYREEFNFNRNDILSSDFISGVVDTSTILETPTTNVGGRSITINSTLGRVATRYEQEPITGYRSDGGYYLSNSYSNTSTLMLSNTTLRNIIERYGDLSEDGNTVTLYTFFHLRSAYNVVFQTMVNGEQTTLSMPAGSDEYILTANGVGTRTSNLGVTCEPFDLIDVDVTDKLVYSYNSATQKTTFYSFDNMTIGDTVVSESGTYSFQGMPTNDISSYVVAVNFKEEFTIDNRALNSDTSINYNSSIWYVDSATDLLNIAYRVYCQGLPLAKKIVQTSDIDFNGENMLPIGTEVQPFASVYDGQYYRIENMTITGGNAEDIGLFGYTDGATIKNVTLMNTEVSGAYNVGAVAGYATDTSFERVGSYNGSTSVMEAQSAGTGIFLTNGLTAVSVIKQSGTYTSISLGNNSTVYTVLSIMVADEIENISDEAESAGDFIGAGDNVEIEICFVRKSNTIDTEIGGFAGQLTNSQVTNAYTSRSDFGNTTGTALNHTHTDITDISTCPDCDDVFIW